MHIPVSLLMQHLILGKIGIAHIGDGYRRAFVLKRTDPASVQVCIKCFFIQIERLFLIGLLD